MSNIPKMKVPLHRLGTVNNNNSNSVNNSLSATSNSAFPTSPPPPNQGTQVFSNNDSHNNTLSSTSGSLIFQQPAALTAVNNNNNNNQSGQQNQQQQQQSCSSTTALLEIPHAPPPTRHNVIPASPSKHFHKALEIFPDTNSDSVALAEQVMDSLQRVRDEYVQATAETLHYLYNPSQLDVSATSIALKQQQKQRQIFLTQQQQQGNVNNASSSSSSSSSSTSVSGATRSPRQQNNNNDDIFNSDTNTEVAVSEAAIVIFANKIAASYDVAETGGDYDTMSGNSDNDNNNNNNSEGNQNSTKTSEDQQPQQQGEESSSPLLPPSHRNSNSNSSRPSSNLPTPLKNKNNLKRPVFITLQMLPENSSYDPGLLFAQRCGLPPVIHSSSSSSQNNANSVKGTNSSTSSTPLVRSGHATARTTSARSRGTPRVFGTTPRVISPRDLIVNNNNNNSNSPTSATLGYSINSLSGNFLPGHHQHQLMQQQYQQQQPVSISNSELLVSLIVGSVTKTIASFHRAGLVHGSIRASNVFVKWKNLATTSSKSEIDPSASQNQQQTQQGQSNNQQENSNNNHQQTQENQQQQPISASEILARIDRGDRLEVCLSDVGFHLLASSHKIQNPCNLLSLNEDEEQQGGDQQQQQSSFEGAGETDDDETSSEKQPAGPHYSSDDDDYDQDNSNNESAPGGGREQPVTRRHHPAQEATASRGPPAAGRRTKRGGGGLGGTKRSKNSSHNNSGTLNSNKKQNQQRESINKDTMSVNFSLRCLDRPPPPEFASEVASKIVRKGPPAAAPSGLLGSSAVGVSHVELCMEENDNNNNEENPSSSSSSSSFTQKPTFASDVWNIGLLAIELLLGAPPLFPETVARAAPPSATTSTSTSSPASLSASTTGVAGNPSSSGFAAQNYSSSFSSSLNNYPSSSSGVGVGAAGGAGSGDRVLSPLSSSSNPPSLQPSPRQPTTSLAPPPPLPQQQQQNQKQVAYCSMPILSSQFSLSFRSFIAAACEVNPTKRKTADQLLMHPFLRCEFLRVRHRNGTSNSNNQNSSSMTTTTTNHIPTPRLSMFPFSSSSNSGSKSSSSSSFSYSSVALPIFLTVIHRLRSVLGEHLASLPITNSLVVGQKNNNKSVVPTSTQNSHLGERERLTRADSALQALAYGLVNVENKCQQGFADNWLRSLAFIVEPVLRSCSSSSSFRPGPSTNSATAAASSSSSANNNNNSNTNEEPKLDAVQTAAHKSAWSNLRPAFSTTSSSSFPQQQLMRDRVEAHQADWTNRSGYNAAALADYDYAKWKTAMNWTMTRTAPLVNPSWSLPSWF